MPMVIVDSFPWCRRLQLTILALESILVTDIWASGRLYPQLDSKSPQDGRKLYSRIFTRIKV
jgi:hypothetical protein